MATLIDAAALEIAAEYQVQAVLNTFLRKRCATDELLNRLSVICKQQPDAAWQALSLLDQMHRRHVIPDDLYRTVKDKLNEIVFCSTGKYVSVPPRKPGENATLHRVKGLPTPLGRTSANAQSFEPVRPVRPGALLNNRYIVVEPLDTDSASVTFKAFDRQREALPEAERYVSIRWLNEHAQGNPHAVSALQNEYAQLQLIAHPNVGKAYDIQIVPGASFIAMEWPCGELLSRISERAGQRALPRRLALTLIREVGFALASAHDQGVYHGALKPHEILVTPSGELRVFGFARADRWIAAEDSCSESCADFPVARKSGRPKRNKAIATTIATPIATQRDDLFSLACMACELLCGPLEIETILAHRVQPKRLRKLSVQQWQTLREGLACDRNYRVSIREWLQKLEIGDAYWRLPTLDALIREITSVHECGDRPRLQRWIGVLRGGDL